MVLELLRTPGALNSRAHEQQAPRHCTRQHSSVRSCAASDCLSERVEGPQQALIISAGNGRGWSGAVPQLCLAKSEAC